MFIGLNSITYNNLGDKTSSLSYIPINLKLVIVGYEGIYSFAVVKNNLTNIDLGYWLDQKKFYAPGLMKAAYGTFLTSLIVIYENDRVADESASRFNVTWSRVSPVCVSLCNDFNCLFITGESDHRMGREAIGNMSDVWSFNFVTSFSFSLIEQLVGNNVWNTTMIGTVTLGLFESYLNNETLEIFASNGYVFIKCFGDNSTLLFLDLETGIVRDLFIYYGLLGTMPCYHDNITENAWNYGNKLLSDINDVGAYIVDEIDGLLDWFNDDIMGITGGCLITLAVVMLISNPFGWATLGAMGLFAIGSTLIYYADDLNKGWTIEREVNFCMDFGLSLLPAGGVTIKIGKSVLLKPLSRKTVTTFISKNSKNIPYEITLMEEMGISGTINKGYNTYVRFSNCEIIWKNAFGFSSKDIAFNFLRNYFVNLISDIIMDSIFIWDCNVI